MCGVFGVFSSKNVPASEMTCLGLHALQHRGQESCGIVAACSGEFMARRGMGLACHVFHQDDLKLLKGNRAVGHVRYSTTGGSSMENAQPMLCDSKVGTIAMAHNGNISNADALKKKLSKEGAVFHSTTDSEVILNLMAKHSSAGVMEGITKTLGWLEGSYALVILTQDALIGVRDPMGTRPLCMGAFEDGWILASESCALNALDARFVRDVRPGEVVVIDAEGIHSVNFASKAEMRVCAMECIYLAREDSVIDQVQVHNSRLTAGRELYFEQPACADVVMGVPESGLAAALGYSAASGIPYVVGFVKNRYSDRSFIKPSEHLRKECIQMKLNVIKENVQGKRVIVVDDSIVRGNTSRRVVEALRKAGALEVHFRVASPVVKRGCSLGIDTFRDENLVGQSMTVEETRRMIGADSLGYLSLEGMQKAMGLEGKSCMKCFE